MKKILCMFVLLCTFIAVVPAQNDEPGWRLSREEFQKRHEAYLTRYAELTTEEAAKFFPIYNELQQKKSEYSEQSRKLLHESGKQNLDENRYKEILEGLSANALAEESLERTYLDLFKKVISYKKIFKIKEAESRFRQDLVRGMRHPDNRSGRPPQVPDAPTPMNRR